MGKPQEEPSAGKPLARICEGEAEWLNYSNWGAEIPGDDPRRRLVDGVIAKPVDPKILDQFLSANPKITSASCEPITKEKNGLADNNSPE